MIKVEITARRGEGVYNSLRGAVAGIAISPHTYCCFVYDDYSVLKGYNTLRGIVPDSDIHYVELNLSPFATSAQISKTEISKKLGAVCQKGNIVVIQTYVVGSAEKMILDCIEEVLMEIPIDAYNQVYLFTTGYEEDN